MKQVVKPATEGTGSKPSGGFHCQTGRMSAPSGPVAFRGLSTLTGPTDNAGPVIQVHES